MERHFDSELNQMKDNLLREAVLVQVSIRNCIDALKNRDQQLAQSVIVQDQQIDDLENVIEEHIIELIALFQPMAKDLRFLITGMKLNHELERMADLSVNIAQRTLTLVNQPHLKPLIDLPLLAENTELMVQNTIDAFMNRDPVLAQEVILSDKRSNQLRTVIVEELVNDYMSVDPATVDRALALLLIARDLERISDHAKTVAEDVFFMVEAKMVKHHLDEMIHDDNEPAQS